MTLDILLFATLKDRAGQKRVAVDVDLPATVANVLDVVATTFPILEPALAVSVVAVNQTFADRETVIEPGDEMALFPPVSGG